jgi:hypothetical protein
MRKSVLLFLLSSVVLPSRLMADQGIIQIDNSDPQAVIDGEWTKATSSREKIGDDYRFATTKGGSEPTMTATYKPEIPAAGKYNIDIFYPAGENRATNAPWLIQYDGGKEMIAINQQKDGGVWVRLASEKPFAKGSGGYVQVRNNTGNTGSVVIADAVRFVPIGVTASGTVAHSTTSSSPKPASASGPKTGFSLNVNIDGVGKVIKEPDQSLYPPGTSVKLTAVADEGNVFDGWEGEASGYKNPIQMTMSSDKSVRVNFSEAGLGVIVDNLDAGVDMEGAWTLAKQTPPPPGTKYENYHMTWAHPKADAVAKFHPKIPKNGRYDVYEWHVRGNNRSTAVPWTISYKGGQVSTNINQQALGSAWVLIASKVPMEKGDKPNQFAQLANNTPDHASADGNKVVIADAVAFVYVGE